MKVKNLIHYILLLFCLLFQHLIVYGQNKDSAYQLALIGFWIVNQENETMIVNIEEEYSKNGDYHGKGFIVVKENNVRQEINYSGSWSIFNGQLTEKIKESNIPELINEKTCTILSITPLNFKYQFPDGTIGISSRKLITKDTTIKDQNSENNSSVSITQADIEMAQDIIDRHTYNLPGAVVGSFYKSGPGPFCPADALVIYMLKFHQQTKTCPPLAVVVESLLKLNDTESTKNAVSNFWQQYSDVKNTDVSKSDFLYSFFEMYINIKFTQKLNASNARLGALVGADEAWSKAMNSQQRSWQKSTENQNEFILNRDTYRVVLNSQAAVDAAAKAVSGDY